MLPEGTALQLKGIALAIADGISSSPVSAIASAAAVRTVLEDYYCTSDAWSVQTSAERVIAAANSWLHAESRRARLALEREQGYVCTLSVLILKGRQAHIFHVGDARISRLAGRSLEPLTDEHRVSLGAGETLLGRALGIAHQVEIDYRTAPLEPGDVFLLATDGVHEHLAPEDAAALIAGAQDLDDAARALAMRAFDAGSPDNLTVQLVRVDALPNPGDPFLLDDVRRLPPAPPPEPGAVFDGYRVLRPLHASFRSHLVLAAEIATGERVVLKFPATEGRDDPAVLRRLLLEEWVARRLDSPHVLKARADDGRRRHLYLVLPFIEGQSLAQWMRDHPQAELEAVRDLVGQIATGLLAFARKEMAHGDLRPENVLIDRGGTAILIDFGAARVAGIAELEGEPPDPLGTAQYSAPECLLGGPPTPASDLFSLGVIAYEMLTGRLPYGPAPSRLRSRGELRRLRYRPATETRRTLPPWVDGALRRALHPDPARRYADALEFAHDLRYPNPGFAERLVPLAERDPVLFWKALALSLALALLVVLILR